VGVALFEYVSCVQEHALGYCEYLVGAYRAFVLELTFLVHSGSFKLNVPYVPLAGGRGREGSEGVRGGLAIDVDGTF